MVFVKGKGIWETGLPRLNEGIAAYDLCMLQLASGLDRIPSRAAFS